MKLTQILCSACMLFVLPGCLTIEKPVFIDKQTMMEEDAGGDWPDFEKKYHDDLLKKEPEAFDQTDDSKRKKRMYRILNSDLQTPETGHKAERK